MQNFVFYFIMFVWLEWRRFDEYRFVANKNSPFQMFSQSRCNRRKILRSSAHLCKDTNHGSTNKRTFLCYLSRPIQTPIRACTPYCWSGRSTLRDSSKNRFRCVRRSRRKTNQNKHWLSKDIWHGNFLLKTKYNLFQLSQWTPGVFRSQKSKIYLPN